MTKICFHRTDGEFIRKRAVFSKGSSKGLSFNRITDCGSRSVGLNITDVCAGNAGLSAGFIDQVFLGIWARKGQSPGLAVLVYTGGPDDSVDLILVSERIS